MCVRARARVSIPTQAVAHADDGHVGMAVLPQRLRNEADIVDQHKPAAGAGEEPKQHQPCKSESASSNDERTELGKHSQKSIRNGSCVTVRTSCELSASSG